MTDINESVTRTIPRSSGEEVALVELLFFAYRDFVADADEMLERLGFGRAHHRVLHFVGRNPGMTVAQLLDILRITKQSLSRVLKELIEKDYIYQKSGAEDRRQRLLYLSPSGNALWQRLVAPQMERFRRARSELAYSGDVTFEKLLQHLVSPENRGAVAEWLARAKSADHG